MGTDSNNNINLITWENSLHLRQSINILLAFYTNNILEVFKAKNLRVCLNRSCIGTITLTFYFLEEFFTNQPSQRSGLKI